jgi:parallel beta-helix repeat protein
MLRKLQFVLVSAGALALGACSSSSTPSTNLCGSITPCTPFPAGTTESAISTAVNSAAPNTTFVFDTGTFSFTNTLSLPNVAGLTIKGQGIGNTILDFTNQTAGSAGISASGNSKVTFTQFTVQNTPGDGIKVQGANGVIFQTVQATWKNTNHLLDGAYGLYPVQSQNIYINNCQVSGARDTGIYVGQSANIVVSGNQVSQNVAGIEIESSVNADVSGNTATNNSGGILVFALPTLSPPPGGSTDGTMNVRVFNNTITNNNTTNFGDPSGTVAQVPTGTGSFVLAGNNVEVFGNTITGNNTVGFANVCYNIINPTFDPTDPTQNPTGLNPFSSNVYVHDNTFSGNGTSPGGENEGPDGGVIPNQLGELLGGIILEGGFASTGNTVPDIVWDGIANEGPPLNYVPPSAPTNGSSAGSPPNPLDYFIQSNGSATFANLNFPVLIVSQSPISINVTAIAFNAAPFTVTGPPAGFPLPAVDAGITP